MRMSASGLLSRIAVAIDQILRLAPSIRAPMEPVVSSTKATSTVGRAWAGDAIAKNGRVVRAKANARNFVTDVMGSPPVALSLEQRFHRLHGGVRPELRRRGYEFAAARQSDWRGDAESVRLSRGLFFSPSLARACARSPPVGDRAGDRARHREAVAIAGVFLCKRAGAAVGAARRPGGAERARRDLVRRNKVLGRGSARRPEMAGLPATLRPAVLRLHPRPALRDLSRRDRPDRRRRLRRVSALRGAGTSPAGADAKGHDAAFWACRCAAVEPAGRSAGA